jgi:hypothetical protein
MFIASFNQTNSDKFTSDKNGEMPFIGNVQAGVAKATLINGSVFKRNGYKAGQLYLCKNELQEYEGRLIPTTEIISEVSPLDLIQAQQTLGPGKLVVTVVPATTAAPLP